MNTRARRLGEVFMVLTIVMAASAMMIGLLPRNRLVLGFLWVLAAIALAVYAKNLWLALRNRLVSNMMLLGMAAVVALVARSQGLLVVFPLAMAAGQKVNQPATVLVCGAIAAATAITRQTFNLSSGVNEILSGVMVLTAFAVLVCTREGDSDNRREVTVAVGRSANT